MIISTWLVTSNMLQIYVRTYQTENLEYGQRLSGWDHLSENKNVTVAYSLMEDEHVSINQYIKFFLFQKDEISS